MQKQNSNLYFSSFWNPSKIVLSRAYLENQHSFIPFTVHLSSCAVPWLLCAISGQSNVHSDTTKAKPALNFINLKSLTGSGDLGLSRNCSVKPCLDKNKDFINVYLFIPHFPPKLTAMSSKMSKNTNGWNSEQGLYLKHGGFEWKEWTFISSSQ